MDASIFIQGLGLGAVVLATFWDMHAVERTQTTRRAYARARCSEERCPFCRREFEGTDDVVRCASCGTPHHGECWVENRECTIFGCDSTDVRKPRAVKRNRVAADAQAGSEPLAGFLPPHVEAAEDATPEAVTEAAPCG